MKEQNRNPNRLVIIANNKIETRNDRFDRGRKKSKRFYHRRRGCGNFSWLYRRRNISPVVSNRAGGHTRDEVMQNTPVDPFPPFSSPPILSLIFVVVHQPADFAGSPCTFHAVNLKI